MSSTSACVEVADVDHAANKEVAHADESFEETEGSGSIAEECRPRGQATAPERTAGRPLSKIHLLPLSDAAAKVPEKSRLQSIAPGLKEIRSRGDVLQAGDLVSNEEATFAVVRCDPPEGPLGFDTDFFLDGNALLHFEKIQFSAWGSSQEMSDDELFEHCITPYFSGDYDPCNSTGTRRVRLLYNHQVLQLGSLHVQVEATEPSGFGVVTEQTEIFIKWDTTPIFEKVHIIPFQDTLPRAYQYDVFFDYLKPFLQANGHRKFRRNELFAYHGVQFKVVACEPNVIARIDKGTMIYCDGQLPPSLRNLLPPDVMSEVAQLPFGLQMMLLNQERTARELEDVFSNRRGLFQETLNEIPKFRWPPAESVSQATCMVCLTDFAIGDECRRLPCNHVFHTTCVDEWLQRCTDCPLCKANVDRAVRQY